MKVIHAYGSMKAGGITTFVTSLIGLNASGASRHDLLLIEGDAALPDGEVHCLRCEGAWSFRAFRAGVRILRDYDLVMIHTAHPVVVAAAFAARSRAFVFQHGMTVNHGPSWKRTILKAWYTLVPELLRARVICSTEFAMEKSRAQGIRLRKERVAVVPFGTTQALRRPRESAEADVVTVGMAGRLVGQKRHALVLESLLDYAGATPIEVMIAGDGPARAELEALASRCNADRVRVRFAGEVSDMDAFYGALDLLVFPSLEESFGLVPLEAIVRGIPVAAFPDVGGCLSLIEEGNGFIVQDYADGLRRLWAQIDADRGVLTRRAPVANVLGRYHISTTRKSLEALAC